ncbi:hypothetical protein [Cellulosimicrobium sp. JZ28]|uniref:hypothetical protein n=1 Tax=Cellulosimicrobium sp. JZ28 TaxID=1906273 RepID=UPI00188C7C6A|nr:hypothetical protein [Cellulosimicrobium sp. JZ28]
MDSALATIAPVLAVIASAVGLLVAFDQLTQRSRMRRVAEWTKQLADGETNAARIEALQQLRAMAAAHMVASVMVPARLYVETVAVVVAVPYLVFRLQPDVDGVIVALFAVSFSWFTLRRGIRIYIERYRVAAEYWRGEEVRPAELALLHQIEGGSRREFFWALLLAVGLTLASISVGIIVDDASNFGGLALLTVGVGLLGLGAGAVRAKTPPLLHS